VKAINRKKCAVTGVADLEYLHSMKQFPLFMGCTSQKSEKDSLIDMEWKISRTSGLIQLSKLIPLDILYEKSHGAGSIGKAWQLHHKAFAKFMMKYSPNGVLEIGGGHGVLSREYHRISDTDWTIIEPNPTPDSKVKAKYIKKFFDDKFIFNEEYSAIVHSHVFEHIYEPDIFMTHISKFMNDGKLLIFSIPNMKVMLEQKYTNCINFEHTFFLTEPYIEYLLAMHGFKIDKKEYFMADHSIFYGVIKDSSVKSIELSDNLYKKNKKIYLDYVSYHKELISDLNRKIENGNSKVYLFGAHVFAQYLIAFGLKTGNIVCLLDNDLNKQGKRLYGTHMQVKSPKILEDIKNPIVILKAAGYNNEIKKDILENINANTEFWE